MKRLKFIIMAAVAFTVMGCSDTPAGDPATKIEQILMPETVTVILGESAEIGYTLLPFDASGERLEWESSNEAVATVAGGRVTGIALGETTVTASADGVSRGCRVIVAYSVVDRVEISVTELNLSRGASERLFATIWPEEARTNAIVWSSSDDYVASVAQDGTVKGVAKGTATITATSGAASARCKVTVTAMPNVGDYLYSDNTWSEEPNPNKKVVGIVFWVGNPSTDDPILREEFPGCVNGLAVSLHNNRSSWQPDMRYYAATVDSWVKANTDLPTVLTNEYDDAGLTQKLLGYGMTKSLEAFNAAPENNDWQVQIIQKLHTYRDEHAAPAGTSGWYAPSIRELDMLCRGESGGRPDWSATTNKTLINGKLTAIGASSLESTLYCSTIEMDAESDLVLGFDIGTVQADYKTTSRIVRFVLAF